MISIKSSVSALEEAHQALDVARECICDLVTQFAGSLVPLDAVAVCRNNLEKLAQEAVADRRRDLSGYPSQVGQVLAAYRDLVIEEMDGLVDERKRTEQALIQLTASLLQADDDHDGRIRTTIAKLREVAVLPHGKALSEVLKTAADAIEKSVDKIKTQHQLTITQFTREISALRRQINPLENDLGGWATTLTREELENRIRLTPAGTFWLCLLRPRGLRLAEAEYGPDVATGLARAFVVRLRNILPTQTAIARRGPEEFLAMVPESATHGSKTAILRTIMEQATGQYASGRKEDMVRTNIRTSVCTVTSSATDSAEVLLEQVALSFERI